MLIGSFVFKELTVPTPSKFFFTIDLAIKYPQCNDLQEGKPGFGFGLPDAGADAPAP
jgi:hypothetical protein